MIFSQVTLLRPGEYVHLPYYRHNVQQPFKLTALGGSNHYEWVSRDLNIAVISQEGVILPKNLGSTIIEVRDQRNSLNYDTIRVEITEVARFSFLEKLKELLVDVTGEVSFFLQTEDGIRYTNCSALPVDASIEHPSMLTGDQVNMPYTTMIEFLDNRYNQNKFYRQVLEPYSQAGFLTLSRYQEIINDENLNPESVLALLKQYRNYGICGKIGFKGAYKGETSAKGSLQDDSVTSGEDLRIRVYEKLKTHSPIITPKGTTDVLEVVLAYGSSFTWEVEEGPYKWEDSRTLDVNLKPDLTQQPGLITTHDQSPRQTLRSKKIFNVACNFPSDYSASKKSDHLLNLTAVNAADEKLLDPLELSLNVRVACEVPFSLQIFIWKINEPKLNVNTAVSSVNEVFNLKGQEYHNFQVWVFDRSARPFYNFSSIQVDWTMSRSDAATLGECKREEIRGELAQDQYRQIYLREFEGELLLTASSSGYKRQYPQSHSFSRIHDTIAIKILNDIELTPNRALLVLDQRNRLKIQVLRGSKEFAVRVNDSSIIDFEYDRNTQTITVRPLNIGYSRVEVEDLKLVRSNKAYCEIIVADPERLVLKTETNLLQVYSETVMSVSVFDYYNREFEPSQLVYLDLNLKVDSDSDFIRTRAFKITPKENTPNQFIVEGRHTGDHRLIASATKFGVREGERSNLRLVSNHVDLHVFPKLEALPKKVVMAPDCVTSVLIVGGPSEGAKTLYGVELVHETKNGRIIKTSSDKTNLNLIAVKGVEVGDTEIEFRLQYRNNPHKIIANNNVTVKIATINELDILGMQDRKIHVGAQVRLIAAMRSNDDIFTPAICPITFHWATKNDYVFQIHNTGATFDHSGDDSRGIKVFDDERMRLDEYQMAINATALNVGFAEIELTISGKGGLIKKRIMRVEVINILSHDHPTYIGKPSKSDALLLVPPHVEYLLQPNRDRSRLRFSLLCPRDANGVSLTNDGRLVTPNEKGKVTVLVEDSMNPHSDLMMVNVLITNIYSIFVENSYRVVNLASNTDATLQIYLQDNLGRSFVNASELTNLKLEVHVTNPQVVDVTIVDRAILKIRAKSSGVSLVSVYLEDSPYIFDVFAVKSGSPSAIGQDELIHVGGFLDLSQPESAAGWVSEDPSVLSIDSRTGKAVALREGKTIVKTKDVVQQLAKVNVVKINRIEMVNPVSTLVNKEGAEHFRFKFFHTGGNELRELMTLGKGARNHNLRFTCHVKPEAWFTATERQDGSCDVKFKPYVAQDKLPTDAVVTAVVSSNNQAVAWSYQQDFTIPVDSGFFVEPNTKRKIELNRKNPTTLIRLRTPTELQYTVTDNRGRVKYQDYVTSSFNNEMQILNFTVPYAAAEGNYFEATLTVRHPSTRQETTFEIIYDSEGTRTTSTTSLNMADYIVIAVLLIVAFFFVTTVWGRNDNPRGPMVDYRTQPTHTPRGFRMG